MQTRRGNKEELLDPAFKSKDSPPSDVDKFLDHELTHFLNGMSLEQLVEGTELLVREMGY